MLFEYKIEENVLDLYRELKNQTYKHGHYTDFYITDPKPRHIHKALIRDRIVHHAVFNILNPIFEKTFIYNSYSCRKKKGTHKGVEKLKMLLRKISKNNTAPCFVLKCDIRKFFKSIDHKILLQIIQRKIKDPNAINLIKEIVVGFNSGLPIGNLTSQLFANIYLNELDQFIKHRLKIPFYLRYTDDFVIISNSVQEIPIQLNKIKDFLWANLKLEMHPAKISVRKYHQGTDFLGYVQFPYHRILRKKTEKRIVNKIQKGVSKQSLNSYLGVLSHANSYKLSQKIKNIFWFNKKENPL